VVVVDMMIPVLGQRPDIVIVHLMKMDTLSIHKHVLFLLAPGEKEVWTLATADYRKRRLTWKKWTSFVQHKL
jgi:hypothetical protein